MLFIRSLAFNLAWYVNLIVQMILQLPFYFFLPHDKALDVPRRWAFSCHFLQRWLAGTRIEISGKENIPKDGCIIASKHQSIWEFYALYAELRDPCFVLKSELMKIPLFGWYVAKVNQIPIRRGDRKKAMKHMLSRASEEVKKDRQLLIFPEGTRKTPGAPPDYRYGVVRMYEELNCPVVPVALTSGLFWPRRKFVRHPGTLRAHFMEPIPPGLSGKEFFALLQERIEGGCAELYAETLRDDVQPPMSDAVRAQAEKI